MEGCKGCRDAGDEEPQGEHHHGNPYHSRKDKPASTQASVSRAGRGRSHYCLRLHIGSVHTCAPCQLPIRCCDEVIGLDTLLSPPKQLVSGTYTCSSPLYYHTFVLKSLAKTLRTTRLSLSSRYRGEEPFPTLGL